VILLTVLVELQQGLAFHLAPDTTLLEEILLEILLWILSLIVHELIPVMQVGLLLLACLVVVVRLQLHILHVLVPRVKGHVDIGLLSILV